MKRFYLTDRYAMVNFTKMLCDSEMSIITSRTFEYVLAQFMRTQRQNEDATMQTLKGISAKQIIEAYKLLLLWSYEDVSRLHPNLHELFAVREVFYRFTEDFYDYWRNLEKYGILLGNKSYTRGYHSNELIHTSDRFNANVLSLYRQIAQKIKKQPYSVFRQLPAGVNAIMSIYPHRFSEKPAYHSIQGFNFLQQSLLRPPFMIYSKANRRKGIFGETKINPLLNMTLNKVDYIVHPIWIGKLLAFVYIHIDYLHHGVALSNLFEIAQYQEYVNKKPDLIMIYGSDEHAFDLHYYKDLEQMIYIGIVSLDDAYDYFGYLKKMLLTLHNVYMIDQGRLPIHGSMVNILLKDGREKNVIIMGDSGAGKSESLEALRIIGSDYITGMKVVFDDMGIVSLINNKLLASGTETGAFVRLDDLESGYAYREIDRAIFLNPDQTNARVVLPISEYKFVSDDHPIDLFLYANNYEETADGLHIFHHLEDALKTFKNGKRFAKGTTAEVGLVESYFANPFGPVQQQEATDLLIDHFFKKMYDDRIVVGEIYTQLAVPGKEKDGPKSASKKLLEYLINK